MTFLEKVEQIHKQLKINEQAPAAPAAPPPMPGDQQSPPAAPVEPPPAPAEPETTTLSPESEVLLVRLIKKALTIDLKPEDVSLLQKMNDINENNANEVLTKLIRIMKVYAPDSIDIDT